MAPSSANSVLVYSCFPSPACPASHRRRHQGQAHGARPGDTGLLKAVLSEWDWNRNVHCVPAAKCVRSVLDTRPHPQSEDRSRVEIASMGLNSACRIVLDVLECERGLPGLSMPICCFYSIREARRSIQGRIGFRAAERLARDVETLLGAERRYSETWTFQGLPSG